MQFDAGMRGLERGPFRFRLLHPRLAEDAMAGANQRIDRRGPERLRHRDQGDRSGVAPGLGAGHSDLALDRGEPFHGGDRGGGIVCVRLDSSPVDFDHPPAHSGLLQPVLRFRSD